MCCKDEETSSLSVDNSSHLLGFCFFFTQRDWLKKMRYFAIQSIVRPSLNCDWLHWHAPHVSYRYLLGVLIGPSPLWLARVIILVSAISDLSCASDSKRVFLQILSCEKEFDLHENEPVDGTHSHMNGFAGRPVLAKWQKATPKRLIANCSKPAFSLSRC